MPARQNFYLLGSLKNEFGCRGDQFALGEHALVESGSGAYKGDQVGALTEL